MATRRKASHTTITGSVTDLQRRVKYLQANTPPSRLANQVVARANVRPRAIDSDQLALSAVTNDQVAADAITLLNMQSNSVGNAQLRTDSVGPDELQVDSVTNSKILDLSVNSSKLANSSVTEAKITSSAVTSEKIRDGAVARSKIQNSAVGNSQLDNGSVSSGKIQNNAVGNAQLADNSVSSGNLGTGSVTRSKIGSGSVSTAQLENGSVTFPKIAGGTAGLIVSNGLFTSGGLNKSNNLISVSFGPGSNQAARGNHKHRYQQAYFRNGSSSTFYSRNAPLTNIFRQNIDTGSPISSTKKYKTSITDYEIDPKKILNLRLKQYKYLPLADKIQKERNRDWMHGYLAEEVEEAGVSEIVVYDENHAPIALDYGLLSVLTVELLRAQQLELDSLREEVQKLKDKK